MAQQWGVTAEVKALCHNMTGMSDANIVLVMENIEGWAKAMLKIPSTFTFDAAKIPHKTLRYLVNVKTALVVMTPMSFNTLEECALVADILHDEYVDCLKFLQNNPGYIHFITEQ